MKKEKKTVGSWGKRKEETPKVGGRSTNDSMENGALTKTAETKRTMANDKVNNKIKFAERGKEPENSLREQVESNLFIRLNIIIKKKFLGV